MKAWYWYSRRVVTENREAGQYKMHGADLQRLPAQEHAVVRGQRRRVKQRLQHVKRQRGQSSSHGRAQDVA